LSHPYTDAQRDNYVERDRGTVPTIDPSFEPWQERHEPLPRYGWINGTYRVKMREYAQPPCKWVFDSAAVREQTMSDPLKTRWELRLRDRLRDAEYNLKIIGGVWDLQRHLREQVSLGRELVAATRNGIPVKILDNEDGICVAARGPDDVVIITDIQPDYRT
jgi:hypothetical protein